VGWGLERGGGGDGYGWQTHKNARKWRNKTLYMLIIKINVLQKIKKYCKNFLDDIACSS
jgi:hypothetical protein